MGAMDGWMGTWREMGAGVVKMTAADCGAEKMSVKWTVESALLAPRYR